MPQQQADKTDQNQRTTAETRAASASTIAGAPDGGNGLQALVNGSAPLQQAAQLQAMADQFVVQRKAVVSSGQAPIQMATNINHDKAAFNTGRGGAYNFDVGVGMQAALDPTDAVRGSATNGNETRKMRNECVRFNPNLQQTHLLNADLGGFGVYENLYPMTPKANRQHFNKVERHVKTAFRTANINHRSMAPTPVNEGTGVYYEVKITGTHTHAGLPNGTRMDAKAYYIDDIANSPEPNPNKLIVSDNIQSTPNTLHEVVPQFAGHGPILNDWNHKSGNPNPRAGFGQRRHITKREGKADLNTTFSKYTANQTYQDYSGAKIGVDNSVGRPVLWTQANVAAQLTNNRLRPGRDQLILDIKNHIDTLNVPDRVKAVWKLDADALAAAAPYRLTDIRTYGAAQYGANFGTNGDFATQQAIAHALSVADGNATGQMFAYTQNAATWPRHVARHVTKVEIVLEDIDMEMVYRAESVEVYFGNDNPSIDADYLVDNHEARGESADPLATYIAGRMGIHVNLVDIL